MNEETLEELVPAVRRHAARLAFRLRADHDDIESAAMWGLALGNATFDPTRGVPYRAWCMTKVKWALLQHKRAYAEANPNGRPMSLNLVRANGRERIELIEDPRDDIREWEGIQHADYMLSTVSPRHRAIIVDRFVRELNCVEIASKVGCTENRISQICTHTGRRMRTECLAAA